MKKATIVIKHYYWVGVLTESRPSADNERLG
jgi:hypothetical protein